jgi:Zn-dependent peptidase ImmA (M78 family)
MIRSPRAKISAEKIIRDYDLYSPVDVFRLGERMGFSWDVLSFEELKKVVDGEGDFSDKERIEGLNANELLGFYVKTKDTFYLNGDIVEENESVGVERLKFTLAHEIGHFVLHNDLTKNHFRIVTRKDLNSKEPEEVEANYFAAYLLIPDKEIEKRLFYARDLEYESGFIPFLAKIFAVSREAFKNRLETFKKENPYLWKEYRMDKYGG